MSEYIRSIVLYADNPMLVSIRIRSICRSPHNFKYSIFSAISNLMKSVIEQVRKDRCCSKNLENMQSDTYASIPQIVIFEAQLMVEQILHRCIETTVQYRHL